MRRSFLIMLIGLGALLLIFLLFIGKLITPFATRSVEAHVGVDEYVGVNVDTDRLYFGVTTPGGSARRDIIISSPQDAFVILKREGEIESWLSAADERFMLAAGEEKAVTITLSIPQEAPYGNYTGTVSASLYRPAARFFLGRP